jgi:hypothetical protein
MTPEQFENEVSTFLKDTKKKCLELVKKSQSEETYTQEWEDWHSDVHTDDFVGVLHHMEMLISEYEHIFEREQK